MTGCILKSVALYLQKFNRHMCNKPFRLINIVIYLLYQADFYENLPIMTALMLKDNINALFGLLFNHLVPPIIHRTVCGSPESPGPIPATAAACGNENSLAEKHSRQVMQKLNISESYFRYLL